ncbi:MAG: PA2779 family protein [Gammaproteobacteria bacterium]
MHRFQRPLAWVLSVLLVLMPVMSAQAAILDTDTLITTTRSQQSITALQQLLGREDAQQQLLALGVSPDQVSERVASLSDSELARINQGIDTLNAGGDSVLGILLVIFIVFVITDVLGATNIFPFIHPIK